MKILHCIPTLSGGGAERQLGYLARHQVDAGHEVYVAFLREGPDAQIVRHPGVRCIQLAARGNRDPALAIRLAWLMHRLEPDIVHTWIIQMDILAGALATMLSIPWVLREPCSEEAWPMTLKYRLRLNVGRGAGAIVCNSAGGERYWGSHAPRSRRYVIPNAVPLDAIGGSAAADLELPGVAPGTPLVLFAGRLCERQKNVLNVVKAFAAYARDSPGVLLICGEGPDRSALERYVREGGLADRILFLGHVAEVWRWMKRADVFVFASRYEGQPNVVLEAMAAGCPVVLSDIAAHRDIADERTALFADPDDSEGIGIALARCLRDPGSARGRAECARAALESRSIVAIAGQYERVYEQISGQKKGR